jgi:ABC-type tungstate transport system permease subunit
MQQTAQPRHGALPAGAAAAAALAGRAAQASHRGGVDHLHRAVGPVRPPAAGEFKQASGIDVKVVALGTGQAIDMARRGDADVLFVHDKVAEEKFVADGFAAKRQDVMYNDFVLVGPKADPAGAKGNDIVAALKKVATANAPFISRGDKSGTHAAELRFWKLPAPTPPRAAATRNAAAAWARR